jgi:hypothetical protein
MVTTQSRISNVKAVKSVQNVHHLNRFMVFVIEEKFYWYVGMGM